MDKEYWQTRWKLNDTKFHEGKPNDFLLKHIKVLDLKAGAKIFVPLCGKSVDMMWFLENGYHVIGVELNPEACRAFFVENNLTYHESQIKNFVVFYSDKVTLLSGDFFDLDKEILGGFDAIYDRAALIALPEALRVQYAKKIIELSEKNTKILLITGAYNQNEMQGPPFSVDSEEILKHYGQYFKITELHNAPAEILSHIREKGLKRANNLVCMLVKL